MLFLTSKMFLDAFFSNSSHRISWTHSWKINPGKIHNLFIVQKRSHLPIDKSRFHKWFFVQNIIVLTLKKERNFCHEKKINLCQTICFYLFRLVLLTVTLCAKFFSWFVFAFSDIAWYSRNYVLTFSVDVEFWKVPHLLL